MGIPFGVSVESHFQCRRIINRRTIRRDLIKWSHLDVCIKANLLKNIPQSGKDLYLTVENEEIYFLVENSS